MKNNKSKSNKNDNKQNKPSEVNLFNNRIIRLNKTIDSEEADKIIEQLLKLNTLKCKKDITFYINSPGGSVSDGMAVSVGTDGKWQKATATVASKYVYEKDFADNGHKLIIIRVEKDAVKNS